jgi:hypothetical protein
VLEGLEEVKLQLESAQALSYIDPDPQPVSSSLLPVQPFSLDMLPEPLQPWIRDIAYRKQCPLDFAAIPAILMFAGLIGARCSIKPYQKDNWTVVPNLWGGILGDPGTMKSPVCAEVLFPFKYLEAKAKQDYKARKVNFEERFLRTATSGLAVAVRGGLNDSQKRLFSRINPLRV